MKYTLLLLLLLLFTFSIKAQDTYYTVFLASNGDVAILNEKNNWRQTDTHIINTENDGADYFRYPYLNYSSRVEGNVTSHYFIYNDQNLVIINISREEILYVVVVSHGKSMYFTKYVEIAQLMRKNRYDYPGLY